MVRMYMRCGVWIVFGVIVWFEIWGEMCVV